MPGLIPLILIIVPIIEITLFVQIGGAIGLGWTLLVILATAMLGARAIRRQGIARWRARRHKWRPASRPWARLCMASLFSWPEFCC